MGEPVEQQRQDLVLVGRLAAQRDAVLLLLQQLKNIFFGSEGRFLNIKPANLAQ